MEYGQDFAYTLRKPKVHKHNYPAYDLELAVVVFAFNILRHYLYGFVTRSILTIIVFNTL